jgi:hypothetical protein
MRLCISSTSMGSIRWMRSCPPRIGNTVFRTVGAQVDGVDDLDLGMRLGERAGSRA